MWYNLSNTLVVYGCWVQSKLKQLIYSSYSTVMVYPQPEGIHFLSLLRAEDGAPFLNLKHCSRSNENAQWKHKHTYIYPNLTARLIYVTSRPFWIWVCIVSTKCVSLPSTDYYLTKAKLVEARSKTDFHLRSKVEAANETDQWNCETDPFFVRGPLWLFPSRWYFTHSRDPSRENGDAPVSQASPAAAAEVWTNRDGTAPRPLQWVDLKAVCSLTTGGWCCCVWLLRPFSCSPCLLLEEFYTGPIAGDAGFLSSTVQACSSI